MSLFFAAMIHIITVSDGHKHFKEAIFEYEKRLGKHITVHSIKPIKHTDTAYIRANETEKILQKLKKLSGHIILCDERGKSSESLTFAKTLETYRNQGESVIFVLGGSFGFNADTLLTVHNATLFRLSDLVLPHSLALLLLLEQIYRAHEIIK